MSDTDTQQAAPLLTTKFYIPPFRPEMVSRPRLVEQLNSGVHRKLTLISAPAGFGKTTLLSEWIGQSERPVAWLSLDAADNDLARFLAYFVGALHTIEGMRETVGALPEGMLAGLQAPGGVQVEAVLTTVINEIAASGEPLAFILDDYHLITAQPIHQAAVFLLDNLPAKMHLIIASRADPPLAVAGLRGRGQLTELRQADLRFTTEEAAAFLNRAAGLRLSPREISALSSRTEGWIAGLQMAALSMQGRDDPTQFVESFTGSNVFVLDYLIEEVLERQSAPTQAFLLRTSILERLSGPLCEELTTESGVEALRLPDEEVGSIGGQAMLDMLERSNLFITRLDDERRWYRYHRLFADLLRQRLDQLHPDLPPLLHRRASEWHERNGLMPTAVDHALAARDFERAARLIEETAEATLARAEFVTFRRWVEALPDEVLLTHPLLCTYDAVVLLVSGGTHDEVDSRLEHAARGDTEGVLKGAIKAIRAVLVTFDGDFQQGMELAEGAVELLPEDSTFLLSFVHRTLGFIYLMSGHAEAATQAFERSATVGEKTGDLASAVAAQEKVGSIRRIQGRLHEAKALYERALELATDGKGRCHPVAAKAVVGLADVLREWNDLDAATDLLQQAIELGGRWSEIMTASGYLVLTRVRQEQGDLDGATEAIDRAQRLVAAWDISEIDDSFADVIQTRVWLAQGDFTALERWMERRDLTREAVAAAVVRDEEQVPPDYVRQLEYAALGRVYVAQRMPDEALEILMPTTRAAEKLGWAAVAIETLALEALAFRGRGDMERALHVLERALSLGEPSGYVRTFVDEGAPMAELLREAASHGIAPQYVNKLLAAFEVAEHGPLEQPRPPGEAQPSPETLSERELEVLRLLNTRLSSTEMADELVVSVNTVRTHIRSIYGKLGVHSRYEAVARARELNLI